LVETLTEYTLADETLTNGTLTDETLTMGERRWAKEGGRK
jgi:hypothetical protein